MAATPLPGGWEFVAYQLHVMQQLVGYSFAPPGHPEWNDQAVDTLAQGLFAQGLADVRDLGFYRGVQQGTRPEQVVGGEGESGVWYQTVQVPASWPVCWFFNRRTNASYANRMGYAITKWCPPEGVLVQKEVDYYEPCPTVPGPNESIPFGPFTAYLPDRWHVTWSVQFIGTDPATSIPLFVPIVSKEESTWVQLRSAFSFLFGVVAMVVPGIGQAISSYVFGAQLAATYPALVNIATNTAFNAALGGQDIEHAVGRALASYAGGVAGGFTSAQIDSELLARLTAATTTAVLNGDDVARAVSSALLRTSASGIINMATPSADTPAAPTASTGDPMFFDDSAPADLSGEPMFGPGGTYDYLDQSGAFSDAYSFDFGDFDAGGFDFDAGGSWLDWGNTSSSAPPLTAIDDGGDWWDDALAKVTQVAMTALQLTKAYQATKLTPIAAPPAQTVNKNGTITTRNPNGTVSVARPVTGQPVVAADGTLVVNNGDGTYTTISTTGVATTQSYGATTSSASSLFAGIDSRLLVMGALGLGALLLLKGRR